ncbi:hypothetical protein ACP4OV_022800 [Aristida adscensionis]
MNGIISRIGNMLSKLGCLHALSEEDIMKLMAILRQHLADKRYLIVIDDIWSIEEWSIINGAFLQNGNGCIVITTTRSEDVATASCTGCDGLVYTMRPLDGPDSRRLFFRRIFGSENGCPENLHGVAKEILKKCGGIPMAIIIIASLLASQEEVTHLKNWLRVMYSLEFDLGRNQNSEWLRHVLNLCYNDLCHELKTCFLYLHIYPEDFEISKFDLIGRWIAEGFIAERHGTEPEDVAESYFNDLINRSLIQPANFKYGELVSCRVHDSMLGLIVDKSTEVNFMTVISKHDRRTRASRFHRLCIHSNNGIFFPGDIRLKQVRSFTSFWYPRYEHSGCLPPLSSFAALRVLDLISQYRSSFVVITPVYDLSPVCDLPQLRYLRIHGPCFNLPNQIGSLRYLQVVDVGDYGNAILGELFGDMFNIIAASDHECSKC